MTPRASFIVPAFNMDRWLSKTIWSCRNQTIKQIEIIVVNDCSEDATGEIADWHAKEDSRVKVLHLPVNHGQSYARNEGAKIAQADYLFVLDGDDMATRNRVKDSLAAFTLKGCDLLYGAFFVVDAHGTVISKITATAFDPEKNRKEKTNFICHSTMAYTRKVALDVPYGWQQHGSLGIDDWRFQWDAYKKGYKFHHLKTPLCYYRELEGGLTGKRDDEKVNSFKEEYLATI